MVAPQKIKNRTTIRSSNPTSTYIPRRTESRDSERYLYTHVHSIIMHDNPKVKATQVSIHRQMDEQNVVCKYNGILLSLKNKRNSDMCYNMDEP